MPTAIITFTTLIQREHTIDPGKPDQNQLVSDAYFILHTNGETYNDMSVVLRQPFGTDYSKETLEVEKPTGSYDLKSWNHNDFHDAAENYYRTFIGSTISVGKNVGLKMTDNVRSMRQTYRFEIS
jgi:hypothetical protein